MYLDTDEEQEVSNALQMAARFSEGLEAEPHLWRWVIIALHNAVQGMMVLSLRHGNGFLALTDKCCQEWMDAHQNGTPYPPEKLDRFEKLYDKVKHREIGSIGGNQPFVPQGTEGKNIKRLNRFRNKFIHFTPQGWSLELDGLPQICCDCARLISFLGWQTQNVFWHSDAAKGASQESLGRFLQSMQRLKEGYNNTP